MRCPTMRAEAPATGGWALFPPSTWLAGYELAWLPRDAVAGVTLAAYGIPVSLAYASLAGLPPQYGIYGYLVGGLGYALLGSSRQLAIGPTSAISLLVGTTLAGIAGNDPERWASVAALTALVVAVLCALAWLLRLSSLVDFISETILLGFKAGAALTIATTQLPKLFGVKGGGEHFFERLAALARQLPETRPSVLAFGVVAIVLLGLGERLLPGRPVALVVVVASIAVSSAAGLADAGFPVVGQIPKGLPELRLPGLRLRDVDGVVPLAFACLLLAYVEGVSAARALAQAHGQRIDPRQELLGLGAANLGAALFHAYPVAGGLSQSTVNDKAGARTPRALVVASITMGVCLLFLTGTLATLPSVVLAAIVLVAVKGLVDVRELRHVWRVSKFDFAVSMIAFVAVLLLGILDGVMVAVGASLALLLRRAARPHVAFLGRVPGTRVFSDVERHPENELVPGVVVVRVEASILYFNVDHVEEVVRERVRSQSPPPRLAILDLSSSPTLDLAGARLVGKLQAGLAEMDCRLRVVGARGAVRDLLRAEGLEERIGGVDRQGTVADLVDGAGSGP